MARIDLQTLGLPDNPSFLVESDSDQTTGLASASFSKIYAFGDSLSDAGNIYTLTLNLLPIAPYSQGHFTNGSVWVEDLAVALGLPIPRPSLRGGTDFAYGGAETGTQALHAQTPIDLPSQFLQYALTNPNPQPDALYTVSIGANDVLEAIAAYPTQPEVAIAGVSKAVANETGFVAALAARGAHDVLVLNVPDIGETPAAQALGPQAVQTASGLSALYDSQLSASLNALAARDHLNLHIVDTYSLLDQGVANPAAFNLTNATTPIWTGNFYNPTSGTLNASGAAQDGFLFFDDRHPSATGHSILAAAAYDSLMPTV